jgi:catechol 2,3-dioxygenase-like lactoylglutathione lyase family enzyme
MEVAMATVKGPDFIALQVQDIEKSAKFYTEMLGLKPAPKSPPDAILFLTAPIPFAVRKPHNPLGDGQRGLGAALWFLCDNSIELYEKLKANNIDLLDQPAPGPFGMTFHFRDIDGYIITIHDKA